MNYIINEVYKTTPQKEDEGINIYAFFLKTEFATGRDTDNIYIETLDINYPLSQVQENVLNYAAEKTRQSFHPSQRKIPLQMVRERQLLVSAIHVVFDKKTRKLLLTEESSNVSQRREEFEKAKPLFKNVAKWMMENAELFGEDQGFAGVTLKTNNKLWHHQNYVLYPMQAFSYITKSFSELPNGLSFLENANVLALNINDVAIRNELSKQIPGLDDSSISEEMLQQGGDPVDEGRKEVVKEQKWAEFVKNLPYLSIMELSLDDRKISPPTIIVNRMAGEKPKNEYLIERELYTFLANYLKVPVENRMKAVLEREVHIGYDLQDIYYLHFGGSERDRVLTTIMQNLQRPDLLIRSTQQKSNLEFLARVFELQVTERARRATQMSIKMLENFQKDPDIMSRSDANDIASLLSQLEEKTRQEIDALFDKFDFPPDIRKQILEIYSARKMDKNIRNLFSSLGINPNDKETRDFLLNYLIYTKIFPLTDETKYYKVFYSIVSIAKTGTTIPNTPVTKNERLFEKIFRIVGSPIASNDRIYYLVASNILFPEYVLNLFCDNSSTERITDHEVFEFNKKNGMLSKNSFVNNGPTQASVENIFYSTNVIPKFASQVREMLGDKIKDNRFNENLTVKRISEIPYVYERVKRIFDRYKLEYKDLNVIFMSDPDQANLLGGYVGKRYVSKFKKKAQVGQGVLVAPAIPKPEEEEIDEDVGSPEQAVRLARGIKSFQRPFIMLNILNERMQYRENLSHILVHECKHYVDDLLTEKGLRPPIVRGTGRESFSGYLKLQHEYEAFSEEALDILSQYDLDYIKKNWSALKNRIINEYFMETISPQASDKEAVIRELSKVLDRALTLYMEEKSATSPETPSSPPASTTASPPSSESIPETTDSTT